jgi:hypothetical protein
MHDSLLRLKQTKVTFLRNCRISGRGWYLLVPNR